MNKNKFKSYSADEVKRIRKFYRKSRTEFADMLLVKYDTVKSWELGRRKPNVHVCLLIAELENKMLASQEQDRINHEKGRATLKR